MDPHAFRASLAAHVDNYNEHDTAHKAAPDRASRDAASKRRRRSLDAIARLADTVRPDEGAPLSGGYRRAIEEARARLPVAARGALDSLPLDSVREWSPDGVYRCPSCEVVGTALEDFGARLDVMPYPTASLARDRAAWIASGLPDRQRKRIAADRPYPHPTRDGYSYALAPYRQSRCYACRAAAYKEVNHE